MLPGRYLCCRQQVAPTHLCSNCTNQWNRFTVTGKELWATKHLLKNTISLETFLSNQLKTGGSLLESIYFQNCSSANPPALRLIRFKHFPIPPKEQKAPGRISSNSSYLSASHNHLQVCFLSSFFWLELTWTSLRTTKSPFHTEIKVSLLLYLGRQLYNKFPTAIRFLCAFIQVTFKDMIL